MARIPLHPCHAPARGTLHHAANGSPEEFKQLFLSQTVVCWILDYLKFAMRVCGIVISSAVPYQLAMSLACNDMDEQAQSSDNSGGLDKQEGSQMQNCHCFPSFLTFFPFNELVTWRKAKCSL